MLTSVIIDNKGNCRTSYCHPGVTIMRAQLWRIGMGMSFIDATTNEELDENLARQSLPKAQQAQGLSPHFNVTCHNIIAITA